MKLKMSLTKIIPLYKLGQEGIIIRNSTGHKFMIGQKVIISQQAVCPMRFLRTGYPTILCLRMFFMHSNFIWNDEIRDEIIDECINEYSDYVSINDLLITKYPEGRSAIQLSQGYTCAGLDKMYKSGMEGIITTQEKLNVQVGNSKFYAEINFVPHYFKYGQKVRIISIQTTQSMAVLLNVVPVELCEEIPYENAYFQAQRTIEPCDILITKL